jgi:hypothetical protein
MPKIFVRSAIFILTFVTLFTLNSFIHRQANALTPTPSITIEPIDETENPLNYVVIHLHDNAMNGIDSNQVRINQNRKLSVIAYDHELNPMFDQITYDWHMSSTNSVGDLWLDSNNDRIASFDAKNLGEGDIFVTARMGDWYKTGSFRIKVIDYCDSPVVCLNTECATREVDINWCQNDVLPGDVNWDNRVDQDDILAFIKIVKMLPDGNRWSVADFNQDNKTNIFDFSYIVKNFGLAVDHLEITPEALQ